MPSIHRWPPSSRLPPAISSTPNRDDDFASSDMRADLRWPPKELSIPGRAEGFFRPLCQQPFQRASKVIDDHDLQHAYLVVNFDNPAWVRHQLHGPLSTSQADAFRYLHILCSDSEVTHLMCCSTTYVELCRTCGENVIDESPAKIDHCHLYAGCDEDMHCLTLERTTNEIRSRYTDCSSCEHARFERPEEHFGYATSSGGSSNDTDYSRRIDDSDNESDDDSDSD
ncbi:hypothetical protein V8E36_006173 [Tilletia maclaganii]